MAHAYTPNASTFHSTITVCDDGDPATHTAWTAADQGLADNAAYLQSKLSPFISGGTQTLPSVADLNVNTTGGGIIRINKLSMADTGGAVLTDGALIVANGDTFMSGDLHVNGDVVLGDTGTTVIVATVSSFRCDASSNVFRTRIYAPKSIVQGGWAGTYTYSSENYDHIFALNGTLSGTTIWKISNTPTANDVMRFSNMDTTLCTVQKPDGTTLSTLQNVSGGNVFAITVGYISGAWKIIDYSLRP